MSVLESPAGPLHQSDGASLDRPKRTDRKAQPRPPAPVKVKPPPKPKPEPLPYRPSCDPGVDEQNDVHEVYERIAPHFSQTRHKPWPLISTFLHSLPPNSIGLDSGGGNGKYVPTAKEAGVDLVVMDRSLGLLSIARSQAGFGVSAKGSKGEQDTPVGEAKDAAVSRPQAVGECVRGDLAGEGWRRGVFDFAISIAAIHHLSTPARRRRCVQALLLPLIHASKPPYARFMIYVWAYEQSSGSKRRMGAAAGPPEAASSAPMESEARVQDVLVPWVLQAPRPTSTNPNAATAEKGDKTSGMSAAGPETRPEPESQVLHRYYHLFVKGELRDLVVAAAEEDGYQLLSDGDGGNEQHSLDVGRKWLRIKAEGWEADNWWIEGEVGSGPVVHM